MNKEELQLALYEDLKRFHEANKNLELYYDECRNKNIEPDNQKTKLVDMPIKEEKVNGLV